ncbi:hypothetical protein J601_2874 [Acinetobacter baumannii 831240]|nr:hypothetical protein J558_1889 [Acinetobacter baumannii 1106579]EXF18664.1 hypothetical protein J601_2874 [Acinetobacter baumannii 831240]KCY10321.1 hypothetical protein J599_2859 [Acinetobacter baumannii 1598530]
MIRFYRVLGASNAGLTFETKGERKIALANPCFKSKAQN